MTCPKCGLEAPSGMAYCGRCGSRLAAACPACGFDNPDDFAFCGKCGARLQRDAAPAAFASPRDYTPAHRRALTMAEELEMRPLAAHCHLGLGRLEGAPEHLATAATLFRESGMPHWLAEAEAPPA